MSVMAQNALRSLPNRKIRFETPAPTLLNVFRISVLTSLGDV